MGDSESKIEAYIKLYMIYMPVLHIGGPSLE